MNDPRLAPDPDLITREDPAQITLPLVDLLRTPQGPRDRQLLLGSPIIIFDQGPTHSLIRSCDAGYCGYVPNDGIGSRQVSSHHVTARATHCYTSADLKSPERCTLSFGVRVHVMTETATFLETPQGFIPRQHLHPLGVMANDPAAIATLFLGTPYLWGGNSSAGIDCSGLVQAACHACRIECLGDSDQQETTLGTYLDANEPLERNDLLFWQGHVALVTDAHTLIHANAGHMAVTLEPIEQALERIETQGGGQVTARKRLPQTNT